MAVAADTAAAPALPVAAAAAHIAAPVAALTAAALPAAAQLHPPAAQHRAVRDRCEDRRTLKFIFCSLEHVMQNALTSGIACIKQAP